MAQKKPAGKPIKITLTEQQIADIIQRAAKTRRNVRVESLEDRIAPSRIGLPIFGGAEGDIVKDDLTGGTPPTDPLNMDDPLAPEGGFPMTDVSASGDGGTFDPYVPPTDPLLQPNPEDLMNPDFLNDPLPEDPNLVPESSLPGDEPIEPGPLPTGELDGPGDPGAPIQPELINEDENAVFNDPLHVQGEQPEGAPSPEELEEHRLNILRQLRASS